MSVSLVFQEHRHQFYVYSLRVQSAQGQQCQSVWCFKKIVSSFLYIVYVSRVHRDSSVSQSGVSRNFVISFMYIVRCPVRCPECTGTPVSVSLVLQEHRQQFSVYSLGVQSAQGQQCQSVCCFKNIVSSCLYILVCP